MSNPKASTSFINRTLQRVRNRWHEAGASYIDGDELICNPDLPDQDLQQLATLIDESLEARGGEVAARNTAARIGRAYMRLNQRGQERFFRLLATQYDVDDAVVASALQAYQQASSEDDLPKLRHKLRMALLAPRVKLLTLFNALPEGIQFLVHIRSDIIALGSEQDNALRKVERDMKHLLASWFDVGFLQLRQITWESPAALLEKLIEYEAVHEISSWEDLKHRLAEDRRLYAFFHPNMPNEPLIFINVALQKGLATNIQHLLDTSAPLENVREADTAIFYSISNAQTGLVGISFGNFLIKRVVSEVKKEQPQLKQFATLSPIPGFRQWLEKQPGNTPGLLRLKSALSVADWHHNQATCQELEPIMKRMCAQYLRTQHSGKQRLLDPVAHFHSSNGAIIQQLNFLGNRSAAGLASAYGMMVNYLYDLGNIDEHTEHYALTHHATISKEIAALLDRPQ